MISVISKVSLVIFGQYWIYNFLIKCPIAPRHSNHLITAMYPAAKEQMLGRFVPSIALRTMSSLDIAIGLVFEQESLHIGLAPR